MAGRVLAAMVLLSTLTAIPEAAGMQVYAITGLRGRVIADRRPVDWLVEVRLDSEASGRTLATAYTIGSEDFEFENITGVNPRDRFILVIDEDGYEPIRQVLDSRTFLPRPRNPFRLEFSGILVLHLEPSREDARPEGGLGLSPVVDVGQLTAEIPARALESYESALEALDRDDAEATVSYLEAAVELAPNYYDALNAVGIEYLKAGRYRDSENSLEHARELRPNDARALINLGTLHFQEGQALDLDGWAQQATASYRKAIGVLDEAVRREPLAAEARFYLGSALYETGDYARAELLLARALELDEDIVDAHLALLNVYTRLGRYDDAVGEIEAYLEALPDSPRRDVLENVRSQIEAVLGAAR